MNPYWKKIIYYFLTHENPCKSEQIAKELNLSSRTIRDAIKEIQPLCQQHGFSIYAKRNYGFAIRIQDKQAFDAFSIETKARFELLNHLSKHSSEAFLFIARQLIIADQWIKIEALSDQLYYSKSALKQLMADVSEFFKSQHLSILQKKGKGIRIEGAEIMIRLTIIQLIEVFNPRSYEKKDRSDFSDYTYCEPSLYNDIRNTFMSTLMSSCYHLVDDIFYTLTLYLIVAMNRIKRGHLIPSSDNFSYLKHTRFYALAYSIFQQLSQRHPSNFTFDENEVIQFSILLACNADILDPAHFLRDLRSIPIHQQIDAISEQSVSFINEQYHIDLQAYPLFQSHLKVILSQILLKHFFHMETNFTSKGSVINKFIPHSPVSYFLGYSLAEEFENNFHLSLSLEDHYHFYKFFLNLLLSIPLPTKKKNVIIATDSGLFNSYTFVQQILKRYKNCIGSYHLCELYEVRQLDQSQYDFIITNSVFNNYSKIYSYPLPLYQISMDARNADSRAQLQKAFEDIYQIEDCFLEDAAIRYFPSVQFSDLKQAIQFIVYKNGKDPSHAPSSIHKLIQMGKMTNYPTNHEMLLMIDDQKWYQRESMDIFQLSKRITYQDTKIQYILFLSLDLSSALKCRVAEIVCTQLLNEGKIEELISKKRSYLRSLTYQMLSRF